MTIKRRMSFSEPDGINSALPSLSASLSDESLTSNLTSTDSDEDENYKRNTCHTTSSIDEEITPFVCKEFTKYEFNVYVSKLSILQSFERSWGINAVHMSQVCGIGGCMTQCNCIHYTNRNNAPTKLQEWFASKSSNVFRTLFRFLVPCSVPYMMHYKEVNGPVCSTPFFSILCNKVKLIPQELFMLSKLNLGHVVNNPIFCHELAFNPDLYIKDPLGSCSSEALYQMWNEVILEVRDIKRAPLIPGPIQLLPQILEGIRAMMHSILPACLGSEIDRHLDSTKLLSSDNDSNYQYVEELVCFISAVLDACVIPMRRKMLDQLKVNDDRGHDQTVQLVKTIIVAIDLLNYTKVDQINSQIKERISLLLMKTIKVDKKHFVGLVECGEIDVTRMVMWLSIQPSVESLRLLAFPNHPNKDVYYSDFFSDSFSGSCKESRQLSRLVGGFVLNYMALNGVTPSLHVFPLDELRIKIIRRRFHKSVMKCLVMEVLKLYSNRDEKTMADLRTLITNPNIKDTKIYKLLERRMASEIASDVFEKLYGVFYNEKVPDMDKMSDSTAKKMATYDQDIVREVLTLLYLHWSSARNYYCQVI